MIPYNGCYHCGSNIIWRGNELYCEKDCYGAYPYITRLVEIMKDALELSCQDHLFDEYEKLSKLSREQT